ncbi:hypothetical protein A5893_10605 [Pedobacter psychrophilus]|uniref:DUF1735 domain-containing protein n=1 Tax=Pedobacter psychrophilus TaxID=1826909 RepID=A0A179DE69_9SPHI|nr:hypothetical protein [Pedobacter psychrophilus]OAQ39112.1 hypothetical protein A5893_10605 [Pedobacter psychrophilus]
MKKLATGLFILTIFATSCATLQSIVKSTFPYTSNLIIPASSNVGSTLSATSSASSFDQIFTGSGSNTDQITQVRISSAKIESVNPSNQNLGVFKSINIYLVNGSQQTLVANRKDVSATVGNSLVLDINNSKFLDDYLKSGTVRVKMEYVLQSGLSVDLSVKASLGFNSSPANTN